MNRRRLLMAAAVVLAGALSACGARATGQEEQDAARRFLTERNNGTPVARAAQDGPLVGLVERIDGQTLIVKPPFGDTPTTIQLVAGATIHKDVDIAIDAISVGDTISAFGSKQGDIFQANAVRLGAAQAGGGAPMVFGGSSSGGSAAAAPPSGDQVAGAPSAARIEAVSGTVERIDSRTIVLHGQDGKRTTVQVGDSATIQQPAVVAQAELRPGAFIAATGTRAGDVFQATQVTILPAPSKS